MLKMIFPSTADFRAIVSAGGILGCEVTPKDVKTAEVIWGCSVLKMKGNTVWRNGKRPVQSVIKVPSKLVKLQQNLELAIDIFFINKHAFFTTYSTKICFTTVTHILLRHKEHIWKALYSTYKMYMLRAFKIVVLSGDHEFAALSELAGNLLGAPNLNWVAASQHCGPIEQNICFLKEKICSLRHSLPFEQILGIMVVRMVLHIIKFVNGYPRCGGVKHYSPSKIMINCCIHANNVIVSFGVSSQIAKNVELQNSLAPRTRGAILLGNSGNLSSGQMFLALDTGATMIRHQWVVLPMPSSVIDCVNFIGWREPSILTFTNRHGQDIGENPQDTGLDGIEDLESVVADPTGNTGVFDGNNIAGVDQDFAVEPTGVDIDEAFEAYVPLEHAEPEDGLRDQDPSKPEHFTMLPMEHLTVEPTTKVASTPVPIKNVASPKKGIYGRNARVRKQPKKYVPSMTGNKYAVALTQIKNVIVWE
jgi:hypothetical protein